MNFESLNYLFLVGSIIRTTPFNEYGGVFENVCLEFHILNIFKVWLFVQFHLCVFCQVHVTCARQVSCSLHISGANVHHGQKYAFFGLCVEHDRSM